MSGDIEIVNAKITSTNLGFEDHAIFTFWLSLDYGNGGQGFGGYALDEWVKEKKKRIDSRGIGLELIRAILETVGVEKWEDIKGQYIRVKRESIWNGKIISIGHLIEDKWFEPKEWFKQYFPEDN